MREDILIEKDKDEGGFVASYPDLPGCFSTGETEEEALKNLKDAKRGWIEAKAKNLIEKLDY